MWGAIFQKLRSPNSGRPERRAGPAHLFAEDANWKGGLGHFPSPGSGQATGTRAPAKDSTFPSHPGFAQATVPCTVSIWV